MKEKLKEDEKERAINGYLMSLAVFITTMPIPIINLVANIIYFVSHKKQSYPIRWHAYNAMLSQVPLFFINSFTWYFVWQILWGEIALSNGAIAYFVVAGILNIGEIISSIVCCLQVSNDKEVNIPVISPLAHILCKKVSWDLWQGGWIRAEDRFFEMAEKAKNKIVSEIGICSALIASLFFGIVSLNIVGYFNLPKTSPLESLFETAVYESFESRIVKDSTQVQPIKKIVDHLCEKNGMDSIQVYLVEKNEVNAFAYTGRNLAVYTGLIEECDSEDELVAVLGHEIGHVEKRHVVRSIKRDLGLSIVFTAFFGDYANLVTSLSTNHLSREDEAEADRLSVEYLYNADVDPNGFPNFMEKIMTGMFIDRIAFFSDHPATKDRIDSSKRQIAELEPKDYHTILTEKEWRNFVESFKSNKKSSKE